MRHSRYIWSRCYIRRDSCEGGGGWVVEGEGGIAGEEFNYNVSILGSINVKND
jgi:hypothetical protein